MYGCKSQRVVDEEVARQEDEEALREAVRVLREKRAAEEAALKSDEAEADKPTDDAAD